MATQVTQVQGMGQSRHGLENHGITEPGRVGWNLTTATLYEEIVRRGEGMIAHDGPMVVKTGKYTGRSPRDKFVVREPGSEGRIWWGKVNQPMDEAHYAALKGRLLAHLKGRDLFVQDCYAGADPAYRINVRVVTEFAWHSLFMRNLLIRSDMREMESFVPDFTIIYSPTFRADPAIDGTRTDTVIALNFATREVLIGGTEYAGEMKKSVFTLLNYLLPLQGVFPMHCSANYGARSDVAVFFGLSGTGKTTLSSDPLRTLIGDDEHGWSDTGVFNFEGGCYAKAIRLSAYAEPEIYATTHRFGTVLENVVIRPRSRSLDLDNETLTENTRAAYPITSIANADPRGTGGHPRNVLMLAADAFGVLPPIARLTPDQAQYHFLSGYTAKLAGTERGVTEPEPEFSACFGAPFLPLPPAVYARMLGERIEKHGADVWLINTGWTGGPATTSERMSIAHTRAMVAAALNGTLTNVETVAVPGVPREVLQPRNTWADKEAYDEQARDLAARFRANFAQFADSVTPEVLAAGPQPAMAHRG